MTLIYINDINNKRNNINKKIHEKSSSKVSFEFISLQKHHFEVSSDKLNRLGVNSRPASLKCFSTKVEDGWDE